MLPIENCKPNDGNCGKYNIIAIVKNIVENWLSAKETDPSVHEDWNYINNVLVEHI